MPPPRQPVTPQSLRPSQHGEPVHRIHSGSSQPTRLQATHQAILFMESRLRGKVVLKNPRQLRRPGEHNRFLISKAIFARSSPDLSIAASLHRTCPWLLNRNATRTLLAGWTIGAINQYSSGTPLLWHQVQTTAQSTHSPVGYATRRVPCPFI